MKRHLESCPSYRLYLRRQSGEASATPNYLFEMMGWNDPTQREVMTSSRLKEKVLRIIIAGNLPFSFAEHAEFKSLLHDAYPDCQPPSRKTIVDYLKSKASFTKLELKKLLGRNESKVSLALDIWSTHTNLSFLGIFPLSLV
jgi:hypothetical protein